MTGWTILPACEKDLPRIQELIRDNTERVEENAYSEQQKKIWIAENTVEKLRVKLKEAQLFCLFKEDRILGVGGLNGNEVISMYVDEQSRRKGIGYKILSHIEDFARRQKIEKLSLTATRSAKAFYERNGFIALHKEEVLVQEVSFKETRMEKRIDKKTF